MQPNHIDELNTSSVSTHQNRKNNTFSDDNHVGTVNEGGTLRNSSKGSDTRVDNRESTVLGYAKYLLECCEIDKEIKSISQCTSSFFVLLYQRLFDCIIKGIDKAPNTTEKKRKNVSLVLEELRNRSYPLDNISAEEVVKLNEDHISRLIMVFVQIASEMQELSAQYHQSPFVGVTAPPPGYTVAEVPPYFDGQMYADPYYPEYTHPPRDDAYFGETGVAHENFSSGYGSDAYVNDENATYSIPTDVLVEKWRGNIEAPLDNSRNEMDRNSHSLEERLSSNYVESQKSGSHARRQPFVSSARPAPRHVTSIHEPPIVQTERRVMAQHPVRLINREARDKKIERLKAARFVGEIQGELRRKMRRGYDERVSEIRTSMQQTMTQSKKDQLERKSRLREENEKYMRAYATLMESVVNDRRVPKRMMSENTAHLAEYYAASLEENRRMRMYLEAEQERKDRHELLRFAQSISAWQQRFAS